MKWLSTVLTILLVYFVATCSSNTEGYSILCSSEFTPASSSFCVGIPLRCTVQLSTTDCSGFGSPVFLSTSDILLQVRETGFEARAPDFVITQNSYSVTVTIDHYPRSFPTSLRVDLESVDFNCPFVVDTNNIAVSSPSECSYPSDVTVTDTFPTLPATLEGGDIVLVSLLVTSVTNSVESIDIALCNYHPGLLPLSNASFTSTDATVEERQFTRTGGCGGSSSSSEGGSDDSECSSSDSSDDEDSDIHGVSFYFNTYKSIKRFTHLPLS